METMILNQDEVVNITNLPEEMTASGDLRNHFKKLSLIFGGKSRSSSKTSSKNNEENPLVQSFSIFSKKPPKPSASPSVDNHESIV